MGNAQSGFIYRKLSRELPPLKQMGHDDNWNYKDMGMKVFADEKDREQFIYAVIAVATDNGLLSLEDHDFKLHYSRREENEQRVVARIVAVKDGVIRAKIEPALDGTDQKEAFYALRKDIEVKLDRILQSVPVGSSSTGVARSGNSGISSNEEPPAYSSGGVGMVDRRKF